MNMYFQYEVLVFLLYFLILAHSISYFYVDKRSLLKRYLCLTQLSVQDGMKQRGN